MVVYFSVEINREYIQITFQTAHIKNKAFEIEQEMRAISFGSRNGEYGKFKRNEKDVEYFDQTFNIESINEIIIGPSVMQDLNFSRAKLFIENAKIDCTLTKSDIPLEL